ncbi:MAG: hypothetical protein JSS65_11105 [Armatimonadetes bacterium]|nr:hypothetical protein [Armatimonadota bacterium]
MLELLNNLHQHQALDQTSKVFCPICVANGYSATTDSKDKKWFFTANSTGGAVWHTGIDRLQVGIGYHRTSQAVRGLLSYKLVPRLADNLSLNVGYGIESQESGATGASTTLEWNKGPLNAFAGASVQTNDGRLRPVGGFKWNVSGPWTVGNQFDGRDHNPFVQHRWQDTSLGLVYIAGKRLSLSLGVSF